MKKTVLGVLTLAVVLSACAVTAFAAGPNGARNLTDRNNNRVCNNNPSAFSAYADTDENGICDVRDAKNESSITEKRKAFIDDDGDGVCDNCTSAKNTYKEFGYHNHGEYKGNSQGEQGKNFVDTDNDGVCDNYTSEKCNGDGSGRKVKNGCLNGFRGGRDR